MIRAEFNPRLKSDASTFLNLGFLDAHAAARKMQPMVNVVGNAITEALERMGKTQS